MSFASFDDYFSEITGSTPKILTQSWNKLTGASAYTLGQWFDMFTLVGTPNAGTYGSASTTLAFQSCTDTTTGAIYIGGNKTPDTRYLMFSEFMGPVSTANPSWLLVVDMLGYYSGINMNSASTQTFNSSAGFNILPNRQGAQDGGAGVRAFLIANATVGATPFNINMTYTNNAGSFGRALPRTVAGATGAITPRIIHSGTAFGNYGPFLPLQAGDNGIIGVQDIRLSAASAGTASATLVLCRPLIWVPLSVSLAPMGKDTMFNLPQMPSVPDGACLSTLLFAGAAVVGSTGFFGTHSMAWG